MSSELRTITITIVDRAGVSHICPNIPTDAGLTLMEVLRSLEFEVEGICGGMALCASCHVYIDSEHKFYGSSEAEEDMLDQAFFVKEESRLSCQLKVDSKMNGLVITLAPV